MMPLSYSRTTSRGRWPGCHARTPVPGRDAADEVARHPYGERSPGRVEEVRGMGRRDHDPVSVVYEPISRRVFLRGSAGVIGMASLGGALLPRIAAAQDALTPL